MKNTKKYLHDKIDRAGEEELRLLVIISSRLIK